MTQPAIIPALQKLCCLLLSLPGVMRETDLAKSLPAARCEMDSGVATGKAQPRQASARPSRSPARLLPGRSQVEPTPPALQPRRVRRQQPRGIQALQGCRFSAQPEGHVTAAQPFHQAFRGLMASSNPRKDRSTQPSLSIFSPLPKP